MLEPWLAGRGSDSRSGDKVKPIKHREIMNGQQFTRALLVSATVAVLTFIGGITPGLTGIIITLAAIAVTVIFGIRMQIIHNRKLRRRHGYKM